MNPGVGRYRFRPTLGRILGSVALREWHPLVAGPRPQGPWGRKLDVLSAAGETAAPADPGGASRIRSAAMARLEAVLWLSREPLNSRKLAQLADLADGTEARTLVRALDRVYDTEGHAFRVVEVAGGFQLLTRPKFARWLRRLHAQVEVRLSPPALETLAVVAYRQPILRADVEAIRGVQCGEILRQLMERDLVRIVGRSEDLGRPFLYGTTRPFLQVFGLRHLDELPRPQWIGGRETGAPAPVARGADSHSENSTDIVCFKKTEGDMNVKTATRATLLLEETLSDEKARKVAPAKAAKKGRAREEEPEEEDEDLDDEDDEDLDEDLDEDDEDLDDEEDDEEDDDEDLDDEWEEVDDEDAEEEDDDEEEEDDDWDEEDDDDWDDDDDDWDDDDEEEEEEEGDWD